ncbi:MAG: trypsin-like peptidase domain-containing protein [Oscillospiraceae bacterium]|jgi:serine protease Do|nr:trypsin-like peptidase domain-containing protein [Oscillospiraceae bacterium]
MNNNPYEPNNPFTPEINSPDSTPTDLPVTPVTPTAFDDNTTGAAIFSHSDDNVPDVPATPFIPTAPPVNQPFVQPYIQGGFQSTAPYSPVTPTPFAPPQKKAKKAKDKTNRKKFGASALACILIAAILISGTIGTVGGFLIFKSYDAFKTSSSPSLNVSTDDSEINNASEVISADGATVSDIVANIADSVVEITTEVVTTGAFSRQYISSGAGSGVIISDDGYIVTNYHVIDGAKNISVTLRSGGDAHTATIIGSDGQLDIALLKIDATGLTAATLGDSDKLAVGDTAIAIGNPLGQLGGTVTTGIISALSREVVIDNVTMTLLQTNAAINPGNSGGGLFDAGGRLVGIVNAKSSGTEIEGLGFAIPINSVSAIINDLKDSGYVRGRVHLGVSLVNIDNQQTAMIYGLQDIGVYISKVNSGSPAALAGFKVQDKIISVNGADVSTSDEVLAELKKNAVGDTISVVVQRGSNRLTLKPVLEEDIPDTLFANSYDEEEEEQTPQSPDSNFWNYFNW